MTEKEAGEVLKHQLACEKEDDCVCGGYCEECQHNISDEDWIAALNIAISALKKQEVDRWIPVTERLPEDEYVLISKKPTKLSGSKWSVAIAMRTADPRSRKIQWRDSGFGIIQDDKVLAWRPIPEPYTEKEQ